MTKPRRALLANWVGGVEHKTIDGAFTPGSILTEGELVERLDKADTVDMYSRITCALVAVNVVDDILERLTAT